MSYISYSLNRTQVTSIHQIINSSFNKIANKKENSFKFLHCWFAIQNSIVFDLIFFYIAFIRKFQWLKRFTNDEIFKEGKKEIRWKYGLTKLLGKDGVGVTVD